jgi:hypothetical protein
MKKYMILCIFLLLSRQSIAEPPTYSNIYDSTKLFYPKDIAFDELGVMYICATAWDNSNWIYENVIYKIDAYGEVLDIWRGSDPDFIYKQASRIYLDKDYIFIFGFIDSNPPSQPDPGVFVMKFDHNLNKIFDKNHFFDGNLYSGVHHTSRVKYHNNNFLYFSSVYLNDALIRISPFYIQFSDDGELTKFVRDTQSNYWHIIYDVMIKPDEQGYYVFLQENSPSVYLSGMVYDYDIDLANLEKHSLDNNFRNFFTLSKINDEIVYLSGVYKKENKNHQVGVLKTNVDGTLYNSFLFEPLADSLSYTTYYNSLDVLPDGDLILCSTYGLENFFAPQNVPSWISLFRFSPDLELIWHRFIGGDANYETYSMKISPDNGIVIAGGYSPLPLIEPGKNQLLIVKTDSDGLTTSLNDVTPAVTTTEAILFPNPAGDFVIVDFSMLYQTATLQLTDLAGRTVLERALTANHQQVDISGVPAGAYVYRIFNNKGLEESGKLVVE